MKKIIAETADLISILSNDDLEKVNQYVKKLVRKTDPEFVMLTAKERKELIRAEKELANGECYTSEYVWN